MQTRPSTLIAWSTAGAGLGAGRAACGWHVAGGDTEGAAVVAASGLMNHFGLELADSPMPLRSSEAPKP